MVVCFRGWWVVWLMSQLPVEKFGRPGYDWPVSVTIRDHSFGPGARDNALGWCLAQVANRLDFRSYLGLDLSYLFLIEFNIVILAKLVKTLDLNASFKLTHSWVKGLGLEVKYHWLSWFILVVIIDVKVSIEPPFKGCELFLHVVIFVLVCEVKCRLLVSLVLGWLLGAALLKEKRTLRVHINVIVGFMELDALRLLSFKGLKHLFGVELLPYLFLLWAVIFTGHFGSHVLHFWAAVFKLEIFVLHIRWENFFGYVSVLFGWCISVVTEFWSDDLLLLLSKESLSFFSIELIASTIVFNQPARQLSLILAPDLRYSGVPLACFVLSLRHRTLMLVASTAHWCQLHLRYSVFAEILVDVLLHLPFQIFDSDALGASCLARWVTSVNLSRVLAQVDSCYVFPSDFGRLLTWSPIEKSCLLLFHLFVKRFLLIFHI